MECKSWVLRLLALLQVLVVVCCGEGLAAKSGWMTRILRPRQEQSASSAGEPSRMLLPKLIPHPDTCFMLAFVADKPESFDDMEPLLQRLEKDLQIQVRRINIHSRPDMITLYETVGGTETNALPFFYNRRTAQAISGATSYANLRKLAMGETDHRFIGAPPDAPSGPTRSGGWTDEVLQRMIKFGMGTSNNKAAASSTAKKSSGKRTD